MFSTRLMLGVSLLCDVSFFSLASAQEQKEVEKSENWKQKFDKLFSEMSTRDKNERELLKKKIANLKIEIENNFNEKMKSLKNEFEKIKAAKVPLDVEAKAEKKLFEDIKIVEFDSKTALNEFKLFADNLEKNNILTYHNFTKVIDNKTKSILDVAIDAYADYDYSRILFWQFLAQTILDTQHIGNHSRNREMYEESTKYLNRLYDVDNRDLIYQTFAGSMAYSIIKQDMELNPVSVEGFSQTIKVTQKKYGICSFELRNGNNKNSQTIISSNEHKISDGIFYSRRLLLNSLNSKNVPEKLELIVPKKLGDIFVFRFVYSGSDSFVELPKFENDLQSLRQTIIPKIFKDSYFPRITNRPATDFHPQTFLGPYRVSHLTLNGKLISAEKMALSRAIIESPSKLKLFVDSKEFNYKLKFDRSNGLLDVYSVKENSEDYYPGLFESKENNLDLYFTKDSMQRPTSISEETNFNTNIIKLRKYSPPILDITRIDPDKQIYELDDVKLQVSCKDTEPGLLQVEYKIGETDWKTISSNNGNFSPIYIEKLKPKQYRVDIKAVNLSSGLKSEKAIEFSVKALSRPSLLIRCSSKGRTLDRRQSIIKTLETGQLDFTDLREPPVPQELNQKNCAVYGDNIDFSIESIDKEGEKCLVEIKIDDENWSTIVQSENSKNFNYIMETLKMGTTNVAFRAFSQRSKKYSLEHRFLLHSYPPWKWKGLAILKTNNPTDYNASFSVRSYEEITTVSGRNEIRACGTYTAQTRDQRKREWVYDNSVLTFLKPIDVKMKKVPYELSESTRSKQDVYISRGTLDLDKFVISGKFTADNNSPKNLRNRAFLLDQSTLFLNASD